MNLYKSLTTTTTAAADIVVGTAAVLTDGVATLQAEMSTLREKRAATAKERVVVAVVESRADTDSVLADFLLNIDKNYARIAKSDTALADAYKQEAIEGYIKLRAEIQAMRNGEE